MCGICGMRGGAASERERCVERMLGTLRHRGPDGQGGYSDAEVTLGSVRLSIVSLATGAQPVYNETGEIVAVCNGQVYNFSALRETLIEKGHRFSGDSDSEVIVHLYEDSGTGCLASLKGMFAFALWDRRRQVLFIARDRFGMKPLYYCVRNGIFYFSSELKGLLTLPAVSRRIDPSALSLYLSLGYVPAPYSMMEDVRKLGPAQYLLFQDGNVAIERYWDPPALANESCSFPEARERLAGLLDTSLREHFVSDVPVGIFLSGGIDSGVIAAQGRRFSRDGLTTFSMGFDDRSFDESGDSRLIARFLGTRHREFRFTFDDFLRSFDAVTDGLDEPLGDLSVFPTYLLARHAREQVKVCLSGEGGDELFMGYPTYRAHRYAQFLSALPQRLRSAASGLIQALPASYSYLSLDFRLKQFSRGLKARDPLMRHFAWMGVFCESEKKLLLSVAAALGMPAGLWGDFVRSAAGKAAAGLKRFQQADIATYLSDDLLVKLDRAGMLASLEARMPYLDHHLVEFILSLPAEYLYNKRLLRQVGRGLLPARTLARRKQGFAFPFALWLGRKGFQDRIAEFFDRGFLSRQGLFSHEHVSALREQHGAGRQDNSRKLGTYIMFQAWYQGRHGPAAAGMPCQMSRKEL